MTKICYKKDSRGRIRVTEFHLDGSSIIHKSGLLDGKLKVTVVPCKPKNVGRSNETTGEQQAVLELNARYKKKLDEGYFTTIQQAQNEVVILPMLAHSVKLDKLIFPVITSPKLDGMRCLGQADVDNISSKLISRKGKTISTLKHITLPLVSTSDGIRFDAWFDGELYSHGDDFQTNMSLIKKYRQRETERITYHVYDIFIPDSELGYRERHKILQDTCHSIDNIEVVPYLQAHSLDELKAIHSEYLSQGYEGTMVRIDEVPYELNRRSHSLLKYKDFMDETYEIIDIVPNEKSVTQGTVVCVFTNGEVKVAFKCGMKMSHKQREELLINREDYIGMIAEVRFFEKSQNGVPRFPVCHGIRLDKGN